MPSTVLIYVYLTIHLGYDKLYRALNCQARKRYTSTLIAISVTPSALSSILRMLSSGWRNETKLPISILKTRRATKPPAYVLMMLDHSKHIYIFWLSRFVTPKPGLDLSGYKPLPGAKIVGKLSLVFFKYRFPRDKHQVGEILLRM